MTKRILCYGDSNTWGYNRYRYAILYAAVILLVVLVQLFQTIGSYLARKCDKRLRT